VNAVATPLSLRRLIALVAIVPLAFIGLLAASGSAQAATEMFKHRFRGYVVQGFSESFDGCVSEFTSVSADERQVFYFAVTFNMCTEEESFVFGSAAPEVFDVSRRLSSAHVVATIPIFDELTGELVDEIELDNVWTATDRPVKVRSTFSEQLPGAFRFSTSFNGMFAPATVSGTVDLDEGSIGKFSTMEMFISHS
jgi:hypothetical protein